MHSETQQYVDMSYIVRVTLVLSLIALLAMYTETMVLPAMRKLMIEFHVSEADIAWILTAYLLAGVASTPLMGKLSDLYGRKRILLLVLAMYALGLTLCSFSKNFTSFVISRALQGIGMAMFPVAFSIVREQLPARYIPIAQGMISAMFGIGSIIGLIVGAHVLQYFGWRTLFRSAAILAWGLILVEHLTVREVPREFRGGRIDYVGLFLLSAGTALLCFAFERASYLGWTSTPVLMSIATGIVCYIAFMFWELAETEPFVDLRRLAEINVMVSNLAGIVAGFGMFLFFQVFILYLEIPKPAGFGLSIVEVGYYMTGPSIAMLITSGIIGRLITKIGVRRSLIMSAAYLLGACLLFLAVNIHSLLQVVAAFTIVMSAIGSLLVSLINLLVLSVTREEVGLMTAINMVWRYVGGSLGTALGGYLQSTITTAIVELVAGHIFAMTAPAPEVVRVSMAIVASLAILILLICLKAREVYPGLETTQS